MRACGWGDRRSLQCTMRGRGISSANRVWPVTLARASTRRRGTPITRSSSASAFAFSTGDFVASFWSAIQKYGAGPAFPQFTAVLRAGMAKIFAKNLEQRLVRREGNIDLFTVQRHPDL